MITIDAIYNVLSNVVPLYVAMILGYIWVKWLKVITPDQCTAISKFVSHFAVPLLSYSFISSNNPYTMNYRFLAADTLQKVIVMVVLTIWCRCSSRGSLDWVITLFSVSTLPSLLIVGVPMLGVMYGRDSESYLVQAVLLQYLFWFPLLLVLLEYRGASLLMSQNDEIKSQYLSLDDEESNGASNNTNQAVHPKDFDDDYAREETNNPGKRASPNEVDGDEALTSSLIRPKANGNSKSTNSMTRIILITVWRRLISNPNYYASILGLIWSLISFRWHVEMPAIVANSIDILSDGALGMAMFSLGVFMALQPKVIECGKTVAAFAAVWKFIVGPLIMAIASIIVGLRGTLLHIAIVQAAMPLGIVTFVFAKEYNVHPNIQSTGIIFGMVIALPITLFYYILLGL